MPIVPLLTFAGGGGGGGYTPNFPNSRGEARVVVEVAWGYTSETLDADLTWTDETDYAIQIDTDSGRSTEHELTPAGRATIVLKNTTRRYDPTHSAGALYSSISGKIGHPVRVRAIYGAGSGTTVDIWRGFVDRIDQGWDVQYAEKYATAILTCSDAIAELSTATLPDSAWQVEVLRGVKFEDDGSAVPDPPIHQWRFGENTGTVCRDSTTLTSPGALNGTYVTSGTNPVTYNYRAALTKGSPDGAIQFVFSNSDHVTLPSGAWTPPFTVVARLVLVDNDAINPIILIDPAGSAQFYFGVTSSNFLTVTFHDGTNTRSATASTTALEIGTAYTVACVVLANAAPKLYVATGSTVTGDLSAGFETVSASGSGTLSAITGTGYIGRNGGSSYMWGVLDELTVFDYDASALEGYGGSPLTRLDDYHDVAVDAWDEDTFQLRCKKILDAVFWPVDRRTISTTSTWEYDPAEFTGSSAMQYLNEIARSEDGLIWAGPDGKIHCEDRRERYTATRSTVSQATIGDAASGASARYFACVADGQDRSWVRQRIVARRKGGSDIIAQDPTFKRGESEDLGTLMLRDEANVQAMVDRRLTQRKTPAQRFTQVTWTPRRNSQYALLERTISDRVTIKKTPQGVGSEISQASWIEGISHSISKRTARWDVTWRVSPCLADPD